MIALHIPANHPAFDGHFPGHPIVPGVVLLDLAQVAITDTTGLKLNGLAMVKFLRPVSPGEQVTLQYDSVSAGIRFSLLVGEHTVASGRFNVAEA